MNILLINNGTEHIKELQDFILANNNHNLTTIEREYIPLTNIKNYQLIILSGSATKPVALYPQEYDYEIELVKNAKLPIIGICMGFEVIAFAYGAKLKEMPAQEKGILEISITHKDLIFKENKTHTKKTFKVTENHRWVVEKVASPLLELAKSKDGVEIIKHSTKPIFGFQFHPELLVESTEGKIIFNNLLNRLNYDHA